MNVKHGWLVEVELLILEEAQHQLVVHMIVLMTEVLSVKVYAHDNHWLLSDIDNGFCNTPSILLNNILFLSA